MTTKRKRGKVVAEVVPTELDEMTNTGPIEPSDIDKEVPQSEQ